MTSSAESTRQGVSHASEHNAEIARPGQRPALGSALGSNAGLLVVEIVSGIAFGSLALLADATRLVAPIAVQGAGLAVVAPLGRRAWLCDVGGWVASVDGCARTCWATVMGLRPTTAERALSSGQAGGVGCPVGEPSPDTSRSVLSQTVTWPDVVSSALYGDLFTRRGPFVRSQV